LRLIEITSFRIKSEEPKESEEKGQKESIEVPELVQYITKVKYEEELEETKINDAEEPDKLIQMDHYNIDGQINRSILSFGDWEEKSRVLKVWSEVCRFTQAEIRNRVTASLIYRDTGCHLHLEGRFQQIYINMEESK
jgi:hypothetical protein